MAKPERWLGGKLEDVRAFIGDVYGHDLHAKRVAALAGATLGVMTSASLAVAMIGQALAQARGLVTKHAIKQVDRLLSNRKVDVWEVSPTGFRIWSQRVGRLSLPWTGPTSTATGRRRSPSIW